jgi:hypothetical protein
MWSKSATALWKIISWIVVLPFSKTKFFCFVSRYKGQEPIFPPFVLQKRASKGYSNFSITKFKAFYVCQSDPDTRFSTYAFFHQTTPPRPLMNGLKPFWIRLCIRRGNLQKQLQFVSMTPLCMSQRCQWHHCAYHNGVKTNFFEYFCEWS